MPKAQVTRPLVTCWLCGKKHRKYMAKHHVMGVDNDPDLTVDLCRGCHRLEKILSMYIRILTDSHKLADLITLARFHAGLPDAKTVIKYIENPCPPKSKK